MEKNWAPHIEEVASAYLRWWYPSPTPQRPNVMECGDIFPITIMDLYTLNATTTITQRNDQVAAVTLVEASYLGVSPVNPSMAISLKTLELYRLIRQRKPSFSFEAFAKVCVICTR